MKATKETMRFDDPTTDLFAGADTTRIAALRFGRRFIGVERDPKMAAAVRAVLP